MGSFPLAHERPSLPPVQRFALGLGRLFGWRVQISVPVPDKCVVVGAHHTSNLDFFAALLLIFGGGLKMRWLAKHSLFWPPLGLLMTALGGVPVDRRRKNDLVRQMVNAFGSADRFRLGVLPEGTRHYRSHWKTGFYYIATGAQVPILFGYADFARKEVGVGGCLVPSGDIERDLDVLRQFYEGVQGRYPELHGIVALREDKGQG